MEKKLENTELRHQYVSTDSGLDMQHAQTHETHNKDLAGKPGRHISVGILMCG
jgi:hypothetical protein